MAPRVRRRGAKDFTHSITYHEWVWLTRWPVLVGLGTGVGGLLVGFVLGAISKQCGGW